MDSIGVQVAVLLAIAFLLERLAAGRRGGRRGSAAPFLTWLVLTALTLWCGSILAFAAIHALLFAMGTEAAAVGMVVSAILLLGAPVALALLVRRWTGELPTHG